MATKLVDAVEVIKTYSEKEQFSCQKYAEYLELIETNPSYGYKRCAKILGVPQGRTRWWHTKGVKNAIPLPLKTTKKLSESGLLPFTTEHKHVEPILNILGTLFGDGGIDVRLNTLSFISSDLRDIHAWKNDLLEIFPFAKDKIDLREGGEWGHSYCIRTFDRSVIRFFAALQAPIGDKVKTPYHLPDYLFQLPKPCHLAFLDGLLASELGVPMFRGIKFRTRSKRFTNFSLGLSKIEELEQEHRQFLAQLKRFLDSVGVTTTPNIRKVSNSTQPRKDGHKSHCYSIYFQTHFEKVLHFADLFPLRYAADKKKRLEREIVEGLKYKAENRFHDSTPLYNVFNT